MTQRDAGAVDGGGPDRGLVPVLVLVAAFVAWFLVLCVQKWRAYGYGDFDLPIFDQALWSTSRVGGFFPSSIRFGSLFADHVPLILVAVVPLYWLFDWLVPGAVILLALQVVAVGSAAIPLALLARRLVGATAGIAVAAAYLLHPATGYLVLFEFHPVALAVPILCWMLWALHEDRWRAFVGFMVLALACREDVALPVAGIGVYALWRAWRAGRPIATWVTGRWFVVPVVIAGAWFALAVFAIVPSAQPDGAPVDASPFVWLYAHHVPPGAAPGALDVAASLLGSPVDALTRSAAQKPVAEYTWQLLAPTGGLALLSPIALVPALPTWFLNVTSAKFETSSICYQYTAGLLPFLYLGTILSLAWLGARSSRGDSDRLPGRAGPLRRWPGVLPFALVLSAVAANLAWGKVAHPRSDPLDAVHRPDEPLQLYSTDYERGVSDRARDALVALVPPEASLVTTFAYLHRVPMRANLYSWHYVRSGTDPITGAAVTTPPADYVLLDTSDALAFGSFGGLGSGARQRSYLHGYSLVARAGPSILFVRGPVGRVAQVVARSGTERTLPERGDRARAQGVGIVMTSHVIEDARTEADVDDGSGASALCLTATWAASEAFLARAANGTDGFRRHGTLWVRVSLLGPDGARQDTRFALSHGMHPISEWTGFDDARPDAEYTVVTATYPLRVPPGTWSVRVEVDHAPWPRPDPLASFDLGEISVP